MLRILVLSKILIILSFLKLTWSQSPKDENFCDFVLTDQSLGPCCAAVGIRGILVKYPMWSPASSSRTLVFGFSESRAARTQPAVPAPTKKTDY